MGDKKMLAINGGPKAITRPLPNRGSMDHREKAAVDALFDEAIATGECIGYNGPQEEALCKEFADYIGVKYADGVSSGTNSVYVALRALDLPPFSEVIVGPITDPGGIMPIVMCCCIPVVADAKKGSYNTCAEEIEKMITPLTKAIVVAHISGEPVDMVPVMELAKKYNLKVVEDCAQAHHAKLNGQFVGTFGDISGMSTMFGKHHNAGGQGGMVFTDNEELYWKARQCADRGKPFGLPAGSENCRANINSNLSEIGAAIGRVQLRKLPKFVEDRRKVIAKLTEGLKDVRSITIPEIPAGAEHSYWFWRLRFNPEGLSCDKAEYVNALIAEGLSCAVDYAALPHTYDWFTNKCAFGNDGFPWSAPQYTGKYGMGCVFETPNAKEAIKTHFNLYFNESWTDEDIAMVVDTFKKVDAAFRG